MKKDVPFLVMLLTLVLANLVILFAASPPTFPLQRWDDELGLERKIEEMRAIENAEADVLYDSLFGSVPDAGR